MKIKSTNDSVICVCACWRVGPKLPRFLSKSFAAQTPYPLLVMKIKEILSTLTRETKEREKTYNQSEI